MSDEWWRLRPLRPSQRDWKAKVHPRVAQADRGAHMGIAFLADRAINDETASSRASWLDYLALALEPRITELQQRRMEGQR